MKIPLVVVYFDEKLDKSRKHHEVTNKLIKLWTRFYKKSFQNFHPMMLLDVNTEIPKDWPYDCIRVADSEPPYRFDVLHKVGWIKSQAYDLVGKCIVCDLDCIFIKKFDYDFLDDYSIAMPVDISKRKYKDWPDIQEELNAGFIFQNSKDIRKKFINLWSSRSDYSNITYFDEIIFSSILFELQGKVLDSSFNVSWEYDDDAQLYKKLIDKNSKILHFHGKRKELIYKSLQII
jgi:hypothetical protein